MTYSMYTLSGTENLTKIDRIGSHTEINYQEWVSKLKQRMCDIRQSLVLAPLIIAILWVMGN